MCQKLFSTAFLITIAVLFITVSGVAQTPNNVEKAMRFRANTNATELSTTSPAEVKINEVSKANVPAMENKSSSQLEALGSRYAWATSNSQLQALGSRYAWATSNSQLESLGSRYAWATSNSQLELLGSRYAWATSNSQLETLGSRYAWATSNSQLSSLGSRYAWATSTPQLIF